MNTKYQDMIVKIVKEKEFVNIIIENIYVEIVREKEFVNITREDIIV